MIWLSLALKREQIGLDAGINGWSRQIFAVWDTLMNKTRLIDQPERPPPHSASNEAEVNPPEWSRERMGRCCKGSSWRSSGWRRPLRRRESCTSPALRSAPTGYSPGAGSRRTGSRRKRRRRQRRSGSRLSRQRPTWKSNRSKSYWGLPTRKTAWRESWIEMVIGCFSSYLDVCYDSEVTVGEALQKDIWVKLFCPEILKRVKMWAGFVVF